MLTCMNNNFLTGIIFTYCRLERGTTVIGRIYRLRTWWKSQVLQWIACSILVSIYTTTGWRLEKTTSILFTPPLLSLYVPWTSPPTPFLAGYVGMECFTTYICAVVLQHTSKTILQHMIDHPRGNQSPNKDVFQFSPEKPTPTPRNPAAVAITATPPCRSFLQHRLL